MTGLTNVSEKKPTESNFKVMWVCKFQIKVESDCQSVLFLKTINVMESRLDNCKP